MTNLVEMIAKALVNNPNEVKVTTAQGADGDVIRLQVAASDMGKVIGKQGRIAKALRTVVKAACVKENRNVNVEIVSDEEVKGESVSDSSVEPKEEMVQEETAQNETEDDTEVDEPVVDDSLKEETVQENTEE